MAAHNTFDVKFQEIHEKLTGIIERVDHLQTLLGYCSPVYLATLSQVEFEQLVPKLIKQINDLEEVKQPFLLSNNLLELKDLIEQLPEGELQSDFLTKWQEQQALFHNSAAAQYERTLQRIEQQLNELKEASRETIDEGLEESEAAREFQQALEQERRELEQDIASEVTARQTLLDFLSVVTPQFLVEARNVGIAEKLEELKPSFLILQEGLSFASEKLARLEQDFTAILPQLLLVFAPKNLAQRSDEEIKALVAPVEDLLADCLKLDDCDSVIGQIQVAVETHFAEDMHKDIISQIAPFIEELSAQRQKLQRIINTEELTTWCLEIKKKYLAKSNQQLDPKPQQLTKRLPLDNPKSTFSQEEVAIANWFVNRPYGTLKLANPKDILQELSIPESQALLTLVAQKKQVHLKELEAEAAIAKSLAIAINAVFIAIEQVKEDPKALQHFLDTIKSNIQDKFTDKIASKIVDEFHFIQQFETELTAVTALEGVRVYLPREKDLSITALQEEVVSVATALIRKNLKLSENLKQAKEAGEKAAKLFSNFLQQQSLQDEDISKFYTELKAVTGNLKADAVVFNKFVGVFNKGATLQLDLKKVQKRVFGGGVSLAILNRCLLELAGQQVNLLEKQIEAQCEAGVQAAEKIFKLFADMTAATNITLVVKQNNKIVDAVATQIYALNVIRTKYCKRSCENKPQDIKQAIEQSLREAYEGKQKNFNEKVKKYESIVVDDEKKPIKVRRTKSIAVLPEHGDPRFKLSSSIRLKGIVSRTLTVGKDKNKKSSRTAITTNLFDELQTAKISSADSTPNENDLSFDKDQADALLAKLDKKTPDPEIKSVLLEGAEELEQRLVKEEDAIDSDPLLSEEERNQAKREFEKVRNGTTGIKKTAGRPGAQTAAVMNTFNNLTEIQQTTKNPRLKKYLVPFLKVLAGAAVGTVIGFFFFGGPAGAVIGGAIGASLAAGEHGLEKGLKCAWNRFFGSGNKHQQLPSDYRDNQMQFVKS